MKKVISLALAASMVAGMAVTSFATATDLADEPFIDRFSKTYYYNAKDGYLKADADKINIKDSGELTVYDDIWIQVHNTDSVSKSELGRYKVYFDVNNDKYVINEEGSKIEYRKYLIEKAVAGAETKEFKPTTSEMNRLTDDVVTVNGLDGKRYTVTFKPAGTTYAAIVTARDKVIGSWAVNKYNNGTEIADVTAAIKLLAVADGAEVVDEITSIVANDGTTLDITVAANATASLKTAFISGDAFEKRVVEAVQAEFDACLDTKTADNVSDAKYAYGYFARVSTEDPNYDAIKSWQMDGADLDALVTIAKNSNQARDNFAGNGVNVEDVTFRFDFEKIDSYPGNRMRLNKEYEYLELEEDPYADPFTGDMAYLNIDTTGHSSMYKYVDCTVNKDVWAKYPEADLRFFNFKGHEQFYRTGDLYLYTDRGYNAVDAHKFVYEIAEDGSLVKLDAKWNEEYEAMAIRVRKLGNYVLSDVELEIEEETPAEEKPAEEKPATEKPLPNTGR